MQKFICGLPVNMEVMEIAPDEMFHELTSYDCFVKLLFGKVLLNIDNKERFVIEFRDSFDEEFTIQFEYRLIYTREGYTILLLPDNKYTWFVSFPVARAYWFALGLVNYKLEDIKYINNKIYYLFKIEKPEYYVWVDKKINLEDGGISGVDTFLTNVGVKRYIQMISNSNFGK